MYSSLDDLLPMNANYKLIRKGGNGPGNNCMDVCSTAKRIRLQMDVVKLNDVIQLIIYRQTGLALQPCTELAPL